MQDIGRDVLGVLLRYLNPVDRNSFRATCKEYYTCPKRETSSLVEACRFGYLNILKEARKTCVKKVFFGDNLTNISILVEYGRIDILEYLLEVGRKCPLICPFSITDCIQRKIGWKTCSEHCKKKHIVLHSSLYGYAVQSGSQEMINWLRSYQLNSSNLQWFVVGTEHTPLLQVLLDEGLVLTERHLEVALTKGNFEMVKFLVYNECPSDCLSLYNAACSGNLELVKYVFDVQEGPIEFIPLTYPYKNEDVTKFLIDIGLIHIDLILQVGNLEVIRYTLLKGIILPDNACNEVASTGNVEVMTHLRQLGCFWDSETIDIALNYEMKEMFSYCLSSGCPISIYTLKNCTKVASGKDLVLLEEVYGFEFNDYAVRKCIRHNNLEALLYIAEKGYQFSQNLMKIAVAYSEPETVILLHSFGLEIEKAERCTQELIFLYLQDIRYCKEASYLCFSRGLVEVIEKYSSTIRENTDLEVLIRMSNLFSYKFFKFFVRFFELYKDPDLTKFVIKNGEYEKFKYLTKTGITECMLEVRTSSRIKTWLEKHCPEYDIR